MTLTLLVLVALLAYANGSNDNSKGVATLVGFGAASPRSALLYATLTTAIGAGVSFGFSGGMLKSFSTGLFASGTALDPAFFVAVLIGAFGWVILATLTGLPVSTTHAIMGSLIGAGLVSFGASTIQWQVLGATFLTPLAISPILSLVSVYVLAWPIVWAINRYENRCLCVPQAQSGPELAVAAMGLPAFGAQGSGVAMLERSAGAGTMVAGTAEDCAAEQATPAVTTSGLANGIHWFTGGLIGFARGWNDAPKIAALCLIVLPNQMGVAFGVVAVAMALGGMISGRKVLETLSKKLTPLPLPESLTASLTTACLVCLASWRSLPVSTTHVSTGAIIGAGLKGNPAGIKWKKVGEVALSWVVTLPAAGLLAAAAKWMIG